MTAALRDSQQRGRLDRPFVWGPLVSGGTSQETRLHLPAGTVTFLLTDIEGSTRLWEQDADAMSRAVARSYALLDEAIGRHGGVRPVEQGEGDSIVAAFARASDALAAALDAQASLHAEAWPTATPLRVRIALHTAEAQLRDEGNYFGQAVNRCARLRAIAHGGQTLVSRSAHDLVVDRLPDGVELVDLGVHRLRDLGRPEQVFAATRADVPATFEPLRSLDALPNNLPDQLTSFVGRERELDDMRGALGATRLLALTGAGGCGKTRLSLQVAADALDRFPDGAWWVELAPLAEGELIGSALAGVLGAPEVPGRTALESAVEYLAGRQALVVLDNCEHVLAAAADVAEALLRRCPEVCVLATSRAPLGSTARPTGGFRRSRCPPTRHSRRSTPSPSLTPCGCSSSAPPRCARTSPSAPRTLRRSLRSATTSTASRSRSSSPPRACACSRRIRSPRAWATASGC